LAERLMSGLVWFAGMLLIGMGIGLAYRRWQWRQWRKDQPKPPEFKIKP